MNRKTVDIPFKLEYKEDINKLYALIMLCSKFEIDLFINGKKHIFQSTNHTKDGLILLTLGNGEEAVSSFVGYDLLYAKLRNTLDDYVKENYEK